MTRYRLMSKKPGAKDWGIRSDRYHICDPAKTRWTDADALAKARREMSSWQMLEPDTAFKIEQETTHNGAWTDLPRNA